SVAMVDGLSDASIVEHGMEQYIPNLFEQLTALSDESLMVHYQRAISALEQEIATLQQSYLTVKQAWIES
ncbi:lipase, partial [Vibrio cholerae]|nr:lipase [Vibrio cholerae]